MYSSERIRDLAGRAATLAGGAALIAATADAPSALVAVPVAAVAAGAGLMTSVRPGRPAVHDAVTALYLSPAAVLAGEVIAFTAIDGQTLPKVAAGVVWGAVTWWVRPARLAARLADAADDATEDVVPVEPPAAAAEVVVAPQYAVDTAEGKLSAFWEAHVAVEAGASPGTHLENPIVLGPQDFRAEIVANAPGHAVGIVNTETLSAVTDIPLEYFTVGPVPGRGAGRKLLIVTPPETQSQGSVETIESVWETRVAKVAMPGATLIAVNRGSTDVTGISS